MKNPTWDENRPHSKEEIKVEIKRLTVEIEQMLVNIGRTQERTARSREVTERNLTWIREKLDVAKPRYSGSD